VARYHHVCPGGDFGGASKVHKLIDTQEWGTGRTPRCLVGSSTREVSSGGKKESSTLPVGPLQPSRELAPL
jgi:hypothetical protein